MRASWLEKANAWGVSRILVATCKVCKTRVEAEVAINHIRCPVFRFVGNAVEQTQGTRSDYHNSV